MKQMDEETLKYVICQIVKGLQYLNEQKISHIDLRPENIFITNNGVVKIGNFGF